MQAIFVFSEKRLDPSIDTLDDKATITKLKIFYSPVSLEKGKGERKEEMKEKGK